MITHDGPSPSESRMSCEGALEVLAASRRENQIVISNQMSARLWPNYSQHPLDLNYLSSTMGGAVPLGLGLALARPDYEVVVLSGDGSLLMNLGCLASVTASGVKNLTIIMLDNGLYEVTGGQQTPGRLAKVDYAGIARASGIPMVAALSELQAWQAVVISALNAPGPRFISLQVLPVAATTPRCTTTRVDREVQRLRAIFTLEYP